MKTKRKFSEYEKMRARMVLKNRRGLKPADKAMILYQNFSYAFNLNITSAKELVRQSNSL